MMVRQSNPALFQQSGVALMPVIDVPVPTMGDSITEGTIVEITNGVGSHLGVDEVVCVVETDKVSVDIRTDQAGIVTEFCAEVDDVVDVGSLLYKIDTDAGEPAGGGGGGGGGEEAAAEAPAAPPAAAAPAPAAAAPAPAQKAAAAPAAPKAAPAAAAAAPASVGNRTESREKMSRMRQRVAVRLKESQNTTASLTTFQEGTSSGLSDATLCFPFFAAPFFALFNYFYNTLTDHHTTPHHTATQHNTTQHNTTHAISGYGCFDGVALQAQG